MEKRVGLPRPPDLGGRDPTGLPHLPPRAGWAEAAWPPLWPVRVCDVVRHGRGPGLAGLQQRHRLWCPLPASGQHQATSW